MCVCAEMSISRAKRMFSLIHELSIWNRNAVCGDTSCTCTHTDPCIYRCKVNSISVQPDVVACDWHD